MIAREEVLKGVGEIIEQHDLSRVDCVCKEAVVDYIMQLVTQHMPNATPQYVPYSEYPLWQIKRWRDGAKRVRDYEFARRCEAAIEFKMAAAGKDKT